ncbi:hypothetical protein Aple_031880 [Acrocarpospora pleiomorpha]|uniref:Uncharacterized protein n=1 Tax=Acrocarpospora pleiomorpha TaxID=90975 RepID=A0A5M3XHR1_9ACTN|nr:hypothetical protein [Acrocarpospora pleiomorpha]GES20292.1 hypothetical protein Aple_031880 [Acrocarpospora pleiomorpha]
MQEYGVPQHAVAGFEPSMGRFVELLEDLRDPATGPRSLDELECFLVERPREVMRRCSRTGSISWAPPRSGGRR